MASGAIVASQEEGICAAASEPSSARTDDRFSSLIIASSGATW